MRASSIFLVAASTTLFVACSRDDAAMEPADGPFMLELPPGISAPAVPGDNPLTVASVQLGKLLFYEKRLSGNGTLSCASCHFADRAFSDTVALSSGVNGTLGFRNAPTLANVAYHPYFFRDGGVPNLELQVLAPLHDPQEMDGFILDAAELLRGEEPFRTLSHRAYQRELDGFVITRAIANYERTLISGWSRFDRFYYQGDATALTTQEMNGWSIFSGTSANCTACHAGFDLSDHSFQNIGTSMEYVTDPGRMRITTLESDRGKFKVPTLRNIALTGPYMHDGSMTSLEEVIDHFASGGLPHANRSPFLQPFSLSPQERTDLIAFLNALTDERTLDQVR